ncbi:MAG: 5-formyltetrahydrofolate cyclo-ligase, partial [Nanoarchaeota archaeon]
RIGYGYGYYDRFLGKLDKNTAKIGLCYEFQLVEKIPEEKHDVPMDIIVTEEKVFKVKQKVR